MSFESYFNTNIIIILLIGIVLYLVYKLYNNSSRSYKKQIELENSIENYMEETVERINVLENNILEIMNDKSNQIKDLYSLQNRFNNITKMNNQPILNHYNHYEENDEENDKNMIFNSVEQNNPEKNNPNQCFIKPNSNGEIECNFYMSPKESEKSSINNESIKSEKNTNKSKKTKNSNESKKTERSERSERSKNSSRYNSEKIIFEDYANNSRSSNSVLMEFTN